LKKFTNFIGKYTLTNLANIITKIVIIIGTINCVIVTFTSAKIRPTSKKTKEFAIKAKNSQNWLICVSTFGEILYLQKFPKTSPANVVATIPEICK
jgi:flagellar motor component MotA